MSNKVEATFHDGRAEAVIKVLRGNGAEPGDTIHSWRCQDKRRFPNYCRCLQDIAAEILAALSASPAPEVLGYTVIQEDGEFAEFLRDKRPHSRACGAHQHEHGTYCHENCPTCHGKAT